MKWKPVKPIKQKDGTPYPFGVRKVSPFRHGKKRSPAEIAADELLIEHLSVRGYTLVQIAEEICNIRRYTLSAQQVCMERKKIMARWREEASAEISEFIARELKGLERQENELWEAWERSKRDAESETIEQIELDGKDKVKGKVKIPAAKISRHREGQVGAVVYQNAILEIRRQRRELLGLDKPKKTAFTTPDGMEAAPMVIVGATEEDMPKLKRES